MREGLAFATIEIAKSVLAAAEENIIIIVETVFW